MGNILTNRSSTRWKTAPFIAHLAQSVVDSFILSLSLFVSEGSAWKTAALHHEVLSIDCISWIASSADH